MKTKTLFILASVCSISLLTAACTTCPTQKHMHHEQHKSGKPQHHKKTQQKPETPVFYQTYNASEIDDVHAQMFTRSTSGGESEMGTISFKETDAGLKMTVDLIDLRPGKTYTAKIYQCYDCNDNTCCASSPMAIDLPKLETNSSSHPLQESYIVRGLTATQLNKAKLVLTRDNGYKAAWGTIVNK